MESISKIGMIRSIQDHLSLSKDYLFNKGYLNIYVLLFSSPQYPLFFLVQVIWSIYVIFKNTENQKKDKKWLIKNFISTFLMVFLPREIAAVFMHRKHPILANYKQFPIFAVIFFIINYSPKDIIPKILSYFEYFIGLLQGINHVRFFNLLMRNSSNYSAMYRLTISFLLTTFDIVIEMLTMINKKDHKSSRHSNFIILYVTFMAFGFFYFTTNVLNYEIYWPYLIVTLIIGSLHGAAGFNF